MEAFLFILVVILLVFLGVIESVRLYRRGAIGTGHFRRIRRSRSYIPASSGTAIEETVEEVFDKELPV